MKSKKLLIKKLEPSLLNPNEMSPDQYNKLREIIRETGKYPSLVVMEMGKRFILLDGHNRLNILKELEYKEAWCEPWKVSEKIGQLTLATINRLRGTDDTHKRAKLIKQLYETFDEDKALLLRVLPETERTFNMFLKIADKEADEVIEDLEDERGLVEEQLSKVVDPDEAERMANLYKYEGEGKPRLVFIFDDEVEYSRAVAYFGRKPNVKKLMGLINGKEKRK